MEWAFFLFGAAFGLTFARLITPAVDVTVRENGRWVWRVKRTPCPKCPYADGGKDA